MFFAPPSAWGRLRSRVGAHCEVCRLLGWYAISSDVGGRSWWRRRCLWLGWWMGPVAAVLGGIGLASLSLVSHGSALLAILVATMSAWVCAASCSAGALLICAPILGVAGDIVVGDAAAGTAVRADGWTLLALAGIVAVSAMVKLVREPPADWEYALDEVADAAEAQIPE